MSLVNNSKQYVIAIPIFLQKGGEKQPYFSK